MADYTKTQGISLIDHKSITHPAKEISAVQTLTGNLAATIVMYYAPVENAANTNPGSFLVQVSPVSSGNEDWVTIEEHITPSGTPATEALSGSESDDSLAVASTSGFAARDVIYIQDTTTLADSEWADVWQIVTDSSINLLSNLTTAKDSADVIWGSARRFITHLNLTAIVRVRVVFAHGGAAGIDAHIKALMITGDSIG